MTTNKLDAAIKRIRGMIKDPATIRFGQHSTRRINEDLHILISAASARGVADGDVRDINNAMSNAIAECAATAIRSSFFTSVSGSGRYYLSLAYRTMEEMHTAEDQIKRFIKEPQFLPLQKRIKVAPSSPAATPEVEREATPIMNHYGLDYVKLGKEYSDWAHQGRWKHSGPNYALAGAFIGMADEIAGLRALLHKPPTTANMEREAIAVELAGHFASRPWTDMAGTSAELKHKVRHEAFDINEPTRDDCRAAADAILALFRTPPAPAGEGKAEILKRRFPYVDQQDVGRPVTVHWFDVLKAIDAAERFGFIAGRDAAAGVAEAHRAPKPITPSDYDEACSDIATAIRAIELGEGGSHG